MRVLQPLLAVFLAWACAAADEGVVSTEGPPQPYSFAYAAGRFPNHVDRTHEEASDGDGVVRGSYAWVDPRFQVRRVEYVADARGFHPVLSSPPADTPAVAAAKQRHAALYARIAHDHQRLALEQQEQRLRQEQQQPEIDQQQEYQHQRR